MQHNIGRFFWSVYFMLFNSYWNLIYNDNYMRKRSKSR